MLSLLRLINLLTADPHMCADILFAFFTQNLSIAFSEWLWLLIRLLQKSWTFESVSPRLLEMDWECQSKSISLLDIAPPAQYAVPISPRLVRCSVCVICCFTCDLDACFCRHGNSLLVRQRSCSTDSVPLQPRATAPPVATIHVPIGCVHSQRVRFATDSRVLFKNIVDIDPLACFSAMRKHLDKLQTASNLRLMGAEDLRNALLSHGQFRGRQNKHLR